MGRERHSDLLALPEDMVHPGCDAGVLGLLQHGLHRLGLRRREDSFGRGGGVLCSGGLSLLLSIWNTQNTADNKPTIPTLHLHHNHGSHFVTPREHVKARTRGAIALLRPFDPLELCLE